MKKFVQVRFLFQLLTVLSLCFLLGSLSAWESGQISFFSLISQCALFGLMAFGSCKLSAYSNPRPMRQHPQPAPHGAGVYLAKPQPIAHSRAM